jgi:hypothetical protein
VIAIGDENARDTLPRQLIHVFVTRLHRIDAKIASGVFNEVAVKIVAVRFGKPRPGKDTRQDLAHFISFVICPLAAPNLSARHACVQTAGSIVISV